MAETYVQALIVERDGYLARGLKARAAEVDAELARNGFADSGPETAVTPPNVETAVPAKPRTRKGA